VTPLKDELVNDERKWIKQMDFNTLQREADESSTSRNMTPR
jgi:hypothetical protein